MTKMEKEGSYSDGCHNGKHEYDRSDVQLGVAGDLTRVSMRCINCGKRVAIEADLNINDIIRETDAQRGLSKPAVMKDPDPNKPQWANEIEQKYGEDITEDEFWSRIKRGGR